MDSSFDTVCCIGEIFLLSFLHFCHLSPGEIVSGPMYEPDQHGAMDFADFSEMLLSNTPVGLCSIQMSILWSM